MTIRNATYHDAPAIKLLLRALGYESRISLLIHQLENDFDQIGHQVLVCEQRREVVGFAAVHFLPQLAFDGGVAIISYLSVDDTLRGQGVDKALEKHISELALLKKCERIQVHLSVGRSAEQQFYVQQGYREYPQYYTKRLVYGE